MDLPDPAAVTQALREYHAAENSYRRAFAELVALLPPGLVLLHREPGQPDGPGTIYWSYWREMGSNSLSFTSQRGEGDVDEGCRVMIVEAPRPRVEYLPRLPDGKDGS
jgi:hypothetical protein